MRARLCYQTAGVSAGTSYACVGTVRSGTPVTQAAATASVMGWCDRYDVARDQVVLDVLASGASCRLR